nr:uncharacterized protein LOC124213612 [Neodiprion pinetum]
MMYPLSVGVDLVEGCNVKPEKTSYLLRTLGLLSIESITKKRSDRADHKRQMSTFFHQADDLQLLGDDNIDFFGIRWLIEGRWGRHCPFVDWAHPASQAPEGLWAAYSPNY